MTHKERLDFCLICKNRLPNFDIGMTCGLTKQKPEFETNCNDFLKDHDEADRKLLQKLDAAGNSRSQNGSLHPKKKY